MDAQRLIAIESLYARNPAYARLYASASLMCSDPVEEGALVKALSAEKAGFGQLQDVPSVLASLVASEALECARYVDGTLYEGDARQLQEDESIPDDARIECLYRASEEGLAVAQEHSPDNLVTRLFAERPDGVAGFLAVLETCAQDGKSTNELQEILRQRGALPVDQSTGLEWLHASYFTTALEKAGALEWSDKRWRTTAVGERALGGVVV